MKLAEALRVVQAKSPPGARPLAVALAGGSATHHLKIFLDAHLRSIFPDREIAVRTGLYGDCLGNLERFRQSAVDGVAEETIARVILLELSERV